MTTPFVLAGIQLDDRQRDGHKGTFGRVLIIGGAPGMSGAVCLSAAAALRGGAGLVTAAVPRSIQSVVATYEPSYMTVGLPCDSDGQLQTISACELQSLLDSKNVVAIGPGMGRHENAADLVLSVLKESTCPVVADADALNLAAEYEIFRSTSRLAPCVITPHPGEFSRLTGMSVAEIKRDRTGSAVKFAKEHQLIVVLKGAGTVVTDGSRVYVNSTGNPGMATGGAGDVLTGLVAACVSGGRDPFEAAVLAVHLHGLAGDIGAGKLSEEALIASDLLRFMGKAWQILRKNP